METWKLLLITVLVAVLLGCVIGVLVGKRQLKKERGEIRPLLTKKERLFYSLSIALGIVCIAFGIFVAPNLFAPSQDEGFDLGMQGELAEGEMIEGEVAGGIGGGYVESFAGGTVTVARAA